MSRSARSLLLLTLCTLAHSPTLHIEAADGVDYVTVAVSEELGNAGPPQGGVFASPDFLDVTPALRPALSSTGHVVFRARTDDFNDFSYVWTPDKTLLQVLQQTPGPLPVGSGGIALVDHGFGKVLLDLDGAQPSVILDVQDDPLDPIHLTEVESILAWDGPGTDDFVYNESGWTLLRFQLADHSACGELCGPQGNVEIKEDVSFLSPSGERTQVAVREDVIGTFLFEAGAGYPSISDARPLPEAVYLATAPGGFPLALLRARFAAPGLGTSDLLAIAGGSAGTSPQGLELNFGNTYSTVRPLADPSINDSGDIVFAGTALDSQGVDLDGIWYVPAGSDQPQPIAVTGGTTGEDGTTFDARQVVEAQHFPAFSPPAISNTGDVYFAARTDDGRLGIWRWDATLSTVVFQGDHAPGLSSFSFDGPDFFLGQPAVNADSHLAFEARAWDGSVARGGLWAQDAAGVLKLVVAESDSVPVESGSTLVVELATTAVSVNSVTQSSRDGHALWFNDRHQMLFIASHEAPQGPRRTLFLASFAFCGHCVGDVNGDGIVDGVDLAALLAAWDGADPCADLNGDGIVDGVDLAALLAAWGDCA